MGKNTWLDVSEHQGVLNWDRIQQSYNAGEIGGVFMRAGYGTATGMQKDGQLDRNRQEARNRRIPRGYYGFAYPGRSSGSVQATGMAAILGQLQKGEIIALDLEDEATYGRVLVNSDVQWSLDFESTLKSRLGAVPLSYMNSNVLGRYDFTPLIQLDSGLWIANYGANDGANHGVPSAQEWPFVAFHQYTSRGNFAGISPVDASEFQGKAEDAVKYGSLTGEAPAPVPSQPAPSAPAPVSGIGTSYVLGKSVPGYYTASDAAKRANGRTTVKAGTYYVFNQAAGMVNVTTQPGVPGSWINPGDNAVSAAPAAPSGNFVAVRDLAGFTNAADASRHANSNSTAKAGNYFVFNTYAGMVNITKTHGVPGYWINPADNHGAPQNIPAPQSYKVVRGDTVDSISGKFGLNKSNNYAQFRALNPNSGHNGDWTNIWPGDVVRVR